MQKTHIPIERVGGSSNFTLLPKKTQFVTVLLFAVVSGFVLGKNVDVSFASLSTDPHLLLGAVSEGAKKTAGTLDSENFSAVELSVDTPTEEPASTDSPTETLFALPVFTPPAPSRSREDLELLITESEATISRERSEVARIRDASVTLVGEFDTNCGDWKDDCARYYMIILEQNNRTYNELIQKIEHEEHALEDLKSEMALIL